MVVNGSNAETRVANLAQDARSVHAYLPKVYWNPFKVLADDQ